jgi:hypothetical protein
MRFSVVERKSTTGSIDRQSDYDEVLQWQGHLRQQQNHYQIKLGSNMTFRLIKSLDSENWIRLSDKLTVGEFQKLQSMAKLSLERFDQFRGLIELEDFQGWSKESGWENSFFLTEDGNKISKVAFVGDEKWKDEAFMFMGKQMRKTAIEFFPKNQLAEAKAWLSEDNAQSMFVD